MISSFFTSDHSSILGKYNFYLVFLSYFIASFASYVALDLTKWMNAENNLKSSFWWVILGAFAMGSGIWTMHFIGMLAYVMPVPMQYDTFLTLLSGIFAFIASGIAFYLIKTETGNTIKLLIGGLFIGIGIVSMHYTGMAAMVNMKIQYLPSYFFLSILIAIITAEAALWLMIHSNNQSDYKELFKIFSALIMGFAVCGMHYTGMAAAIFSHEDHVINADHLPFISPDNLSIYTALGTFLILAIALTATRTWTMALQSQNQKLLVTERILEQKSLELQNTNQNLINVAQNASESAERIHMILSAAADGIIVVNEDNLIEICNLAAEKIFGYPKELILHKNFDLFIKEFSSSLSKKKFHTIQSQITNANGKNVPIEYTISESLINNKKNYITVFRDITKRKESEEKLNELHKELMRTARRAGMADVASSVLHNIGNVLNNLNTSIEFLLERNSSFKIGGFSELIKSVDENSNKLEQYILTNPKGKILPTYLKQFKQYLESEQQFVRNELFSASEKISHIKKIVAMQQSLSRGGVGIIESFKIEDVIQEALTLNAEIIKKHNVITEIHYGNTPIIHADQIKVAQIFVNLIKNALDSLIESGKEEKKITIESKMNGSEKIEVRITDNGKGIKSENLTQIFSHGYTTKKNGHGFGLHSSSLFAQEAGGSLIAQSELGEYATFILVLPIICRVSR